MLHGLALHRQGTKYSSRLTLNPCGGFFRQGAELLHPLSRIDLSISGRSGSRDLVERRIGDVVGFNLRGSLNYCGEKLRHFWVRSAVVSLGILRCVPQTDSKRFPAALADKRDFVLESF